CGQPAPAGRGQQRRGDARARLYGRQTVGSPPCRRRIVAVRRLRAAYCWPGAVGARSAQIDRLTTLPPWVAAAGRRRLTTSSPNLISCARVTLRLSPSRLAVCTWL